MQQVKSFYAEAIVKLVFNITWKNLNIEGKQLFYLINARGKYTEFSCFSFPIFVWFGQNDDQGLLFLLTGRFSQLKTFQ